MVAQSAGWLGRVKEAINDGLTAETAVDKIARELRERMRRMPTLSAGAPGGYRGHGRPAYGRVGRRQAQAGPRRWRILLVRRLGPRICWIGIPAALPPSPSRKPAFSHAAILARALDLPGCKWIGRC